MRIELRLYVASVGVGGTYAGVENAHHNDVVQEVCVLCSRGRCELYVMRDSTIVCSRNA